MNASNTIKLEIVASTEHKARVNAELAARRKLENLLKHQVLTILMLRFIM